MRPALVLALTISSALLAGAAAQAQTGDPALGRAIAETWCAGCHAVTPGDSRAGTRAAPGFAAIARMPSTTRKSLQVFLVTPHYRMPDYRLTPEEIDHVTAYILSLRP